MYVCWYNIVLIQILGQNTGVPIQEGHFSVHFKYVQKLN